MTASITALKEAKKQLRNANRKFKSWSAQPTFGPEGEYTSNSLKAGVDAILIDLSALSKSDAKIIKITTHQERTNLTNLTTKLAQLLPSENGAQIAAHLDALKVSLRPYNLRFTAERSEEFFNNCDELQRRATELSVKTTEIEASLESAQSIIEESKKARKLTTISPQEFQSLKSLFLKSLLSSAQ
ncbi:hypothetical protein [Stutzerimonas zhaodongensis]|uniref:hypothetical protein n=1 Tax=Stutzerimonas TaxID=2901164 RepID=UPI00388D54FA